MLQLISHSPSANQPNSVGNKHYRQDILSPAKLFWQLALLTIHLVSSPTLLAMALLTGHPSSYQFIWSSGQL